MIENCKSPKDFVDVFMPVYDWDNDVVWNQDTGLE